MLELALFSKNLQTLLSVLQPTGRKHLRKAIMKRSALKRKASRTKQQEGITKYEKQLNLVVKLNRETLLHYFNNLET